MATPQHEQEPRKRQYRMAELVEVSGVSRDMIKYYLRARLLPKPRKARTNLSFYSESHLQLIRLVLRFQAQTKLSLPDIADVFQRADHDPNAIEIVLLSDRFSTEHSETIIPHERTSSSRVGLSFPPAFIQELISNELLSGSLPLDPGEEKIASLLWAARLEGVPLTFFKEASDNIQLLADLEVRALIAVQRPDMNFEAAADNITNTDRIVSRWMITEKNRQARRMFQQVIDNAALTLTSIHDAIYVPSMVFRQRFDIDKALLELDARLAAAPPELTEIHSACHACLLLTEYERVLAFADIGLDIAPGNAHSLAYKCHSYAMDNQLEKAQHYARQLELAQASHPLAKEARILTLLMQAGSLGGVSDTSEILKKAGELFREPVSLRAGHSMDEFDAAALEARASTLFPDAISARPDTIAKLESLLEGLEGVGQGGFELSIGGAQIVCQMYACYYLAQMHCAMGSDGEARQYYEKVIQLDPSSNFGERAYLKLAEVL